jgi:DNA-binding NarL/FixJ family response regulator
VRVLIVDDDHGFRTFIRRVLDNENGISIVGEAMDGEEGVSKAQELKPDLILMDVDLPRVDGLEATRQIKQSNPVTGIIMFSPIDGAEYRDAAARSGADDFLTKTTAISQILSTIRHWLPGKALATGSMVKGHS